MSPVRTLRHRGPAPAQRIVSVPTRSRPVHAELVAGEPVMAGLWRLLEDAGGRAGSAELSGGELGHLPYVFPAVAHEEERAVTFSAPQTAVGPSALLCGAATIGRRAGERFSHVHATWLDGGGQLRGGHLLDGACVGPVPVGVTLHAYDDVDLHNEPDPETLLPTFCPVPSLGAEQGQRSAPVVVSRVRPGIDLADAVRQVCVSAAWDQAIVHSSLGSTVGARLGQGNGVIDVPGPAVEFTKLVGTVSHALSTDPDVHLAGTCVDVQAQVHSGAVLPGQNPVAVTFELVVERGRP